MSMVLCGRFDRRYARLRASLEKAQRSKSHPWRTRRSCEEFTSMTTGLLWGEGSQNRLLCYCNGYMFGFLNHDQAHCLLFIKVICFPMSGAKEALVFRLSGSRVHRRGSMTLSQRRAVLVEVCPSTESVVRVQTPILNSSLICHGIPVFINAYYLPHIISTIL